MDSSYIEHRPGTALVLRFDGSVANSLPHRSDSKFLLDREDCAIHEVRAEEQGTPAPEQPSVLLSFASCSNLRFGSGQDVEVRLPSESGISRLHFSMQHLRTTNLWKVKCHSRNGVIVNGVKLNNSYPTEQFLHPLKVNLIFAPYIPIEATLVGKPWDDDNAELNYSLFIPPLIEELSPASTTASTSDQSTVSLSRWMDRYETNNNFSRYMILQTPTYRLPWSENAWVALRASSARAFAATQFSYDHRENLQRFYIKYKHLDHPNLTSLLEVEANMGQKPLLVQPCAPTTRCLNDGLTQRQAAAATQQIISLLSYLHQSGVCHGHIQEHLLTYSPPSFQIQLNGLWLKWFEDCSHPTQTEHLDLEQDIQASARMLSRILSITPPENQDCFVTLDHLSKPVDPLLYETLHSMAYPCGNILDFHGYITCLCAGGDPFLNTECSETINIGIKRTHDFNVELRTCDLRTLWTRYIRCGVFRPRSAANSVTTLAELVRFKKEFMPQKRFRAMIKLYQQDLPRLPALLDGLRHSSDHVLSVRIPGQIPWLGNCGMINLTRLLAITGSSFNDTLDPHRTIEVRGAKQYSGIYVEVDWLMGKGGMEDLRTRLLRPPSALNVKQLTQARKLRQYAYNDHVLWATGLPWSSIVITNRANFKSMWEPFCERTLGSQHPPKWLTREESTKKCLQYGLLDLQADMEQFCKTGQRKPPTVCVLEDLPEQDFEYHSNGDTSVATDSGEDKLAFKRKRGRRK